MAVHSIPLFRIPFLALRIILGRFVPHEIIQLSLCSRRSLQVTKKCWKKKGEVKTVLSVGTVLEINLRVQDTPFYHRFVILQADNLQGRRSHKIRIGDAVVPSVHKKTETVTFWQDTIHGIGQIVSFIKYLFDDPIHSINLITEMNRNEFFRTIDYVISGQESVKECTLYTTHSTDDCLTQLLDNCRITRSMVVYGKPGSQFSHHWNIKTDYLQLAQGATLTFQNLTNMDCKFLWIGPSNLTNEDLNQFLKHWQNGGNSRLKFLSTEIKFINQETITLGIDTVSQPVRLFRYYRGQYDLKIFRSGGIDIRRNDGTTGSIFFNDRRFEFGVDPTEYRR
ncbi:unnamed protein product [Caenorhabditis brenneri]